MLPSVFLPPCPEPLPGGGVPDPRLLILDALRSRREYPCRQLPPKPAPLPYLGQPGLSGGQPGCGGGVGGGGPTPRFQCAWFVARKSELLQLERLSRGWKLYLACVLNFKRLIFRKRIRGLLLKIQCVCVLSRITLFAEPKAG